MFGCKDGGEANTASCIMPDTLKEVRNIPGKYPGTFRIFGCKDGGEANTASYIMPGTLKEVKNISGKYPGTFWIFFYFT